MIRVFLDGACMTSRESAHAYLKRRFSFPDYYGANLDAIWDILSTFSEPMTIELQNRSAMVEALGAYGESLCQLFEEVAEQNACVHYAVEELEGETPLRHCQESPQEEG